MTVTITIQAESGALARAELRALLNEGANVEAIPEDTPPFARVGEAGDELVDTRTDEERLTLDKPLGDLTDELADPAVDLDDNKVPFNSDFCGKAAIPFYASGKKSGQWKRRQGVDEAVYDKWYGEELLKTPAETPEGSVAGEGKLDTAAAFGAGGETPATETTDPADPTSAGELMVWFSEMQSAERLSHEDLAGAYAAAGFQADALFDTDETVVAERVAVVLGHLKLKVKA